MKGLFLFSLLLLSLKAIKAQPPVGIRIGASTSHPSISYDPTVGSRLTPVSRTGLVFGVYTEFPVSAAWLVQPALQIAAKGYRERQEGSLYAAPAKFSYLEAPVNFIYSSQSGGIGFQAGGGPVISFLLERDYQTESLKTLDIGGNVLLGYKVPIGFSLHLQYTYGLLNASEGVSPLSGLKNRVLFLTAGYLF